MSNTTPLGWPVLDTDSELLYRWVIPTTNLRITMRAGNAGFALACFILWWHRTVEKLNPVYCGCYNKRPVTGGRVWSEHAAAIACDLNWHRHPYNTAASATFTSNQIKAIHRKIRWWRIVAGAPVLRWGGDYRSNPDPMHTELFYNLKAIKRLCSVLKRSAMGKEIIRANPTQSRFL